MKIIKIEDEKIKFDNDNELTYLHQQDCCESVYADFDILKTYNVSTKTGKNINIKEIDFCENLNELIEGIIACGFNMISKIGEKFFIPCYNIQNGYYSSDLKLVLQKNDKKEIMDISDFVKDDIL